MTAQPIHHAPLPRIPDTVKGIRQHLPQRLHAQFQAELDDAVDSGDMAVVERVKLSWWATALIESDPRLRADLEAVEQGELEFFTSPFKR